MANPWDQTTPDGLPPRLEADWEAMRVRCRQADEAIRQRDELLTESVELHASGKWERDHRLAAESRADALARDLDEARGLLRLWSMVATKAHGEACGCDLCRATRAALEVKP